MQTNSPKIWKFAIQLRPKSESKQNPAINASNQIKNDSTHYMMMNKIKPFNNFQNKSHVFL